MWSPKAVLGPHDDLGASLSLTIPPAKRPGSEFWFPAGLVAFVLLLFWPTVSLQGVYFYGDAIGSLPRLAWAGEQLRAGHFPGWNPYLAMGAPMSAVFAGFYPVEMLLFAAMPKEWAYNFDVVFHLVVATLGMWSLARGWGQSRAGAALASLAWGLGGFTLGHLQHINILIAIAWLPCLFSVTDRVLDRPGLRFVGTAALVFGLDLTGGHIQVVLYSALVLAAHAGLRLWRLWRTGKGALRASLRLGLAAAVGLGLAAVFLVPFLDWCRVISVGDVFSVQYTIALGELIRVLAPFWLRGSRWRSIPNEALIDFVYLGVLPLCLSFLGIARDKGRTLFLVVLAVTSLLLSLGSDGPLWGLIEGIPVVGWGRTPVRYLMFVQFSGALLAGFGFDQVRRRARAARIMALSLLAIGAGLVALLGSGRFPQHLLLGREADDLPSLQQPDTVALLVALVGSGVLLWALARVAGSSSQGAVAGAAIVLVAADLCFVKVGLQVNDLAPWDSYSEPRSARVILSGGEPARFMCLDNLRRDHFPNGVPLNETYRLILREIIGGTTPTLFHLRSFAGAGGFEPPRLKELKASWRWMSQRRIDRLLGLFSGRYLISLEKLDDPDLTLLHQDIVRVYSNPLALPRAYLAQKARFARNPAKALRIVSKFDFDPRSTVVIEEPDAHEGTSSTAPCVGPVESSAAIAEETPDRVVVDTVSPVPAWLVLNDTFAPGWRATLDGRSAAVLRGNFLVRTVRVPEGKHRVVFLYEPASRPIGLSISAASLLGILALRLRG